MTGAYYGATFLGVHQRVNTALWLDERRAHGLRASKPRWAVFALHKTDERPHEHRDACVRFLGWAVSLGEATAIADVEHQATGIRHSYTIQYAQAKEER